ncbi:MAG: TolC family protein [Dysgonamonadaceae bacterium]|jgi:outer membrane protein TolC|nr:TolC family protein [Dysgonamonadaceae bacterium]
MKRLFTILFTLLPVCVWVYAHQPGDSILTFTLPQAVELARRQSPDVLYARHSFRSSYWNYCYYKANYLPSLNFSSTPNFNHIINTITLPDGTSEYIQQNQLTTDASLSITQNVSLTGGTFSVQTSLQRLDQLDNNSHSYKSTPVTVAYSQSLFGYNQLKWDKKIEPLRFEEAKRNYVEALELVAAKATAKFFNLAKAQTNLEIARTNYANADTLYSFAQGRYNIGTITENEMLQLEINKLTEEINRLNAQLEVDDCTEELRSFLGIRESHPIAVTIDEKISLRFVDVNKALQYTVENSTEVVYMQRLKLESESRIAGARANAALQADLYLQFGLAQTGREIEAVYRKPDNQQYVEVGFRLPVLDWGRGKGQVQVAKSNRDRVYAQIDQDRNTLEMNVMKTVKQFNLQTNQLQVAVKADYTAGRRSDVVRKLYLLGKSNILDLNASISEKDAAKRNYINTLSNYWTLYYTLRSLTLFDFEKNIPITEDYKMLIQ